MLSIDDLFKGRHFDREIIILCVRWYLRFKLSFRDLVENDCRAWNFSSPYDDHALDSALRPGIRKAVEPPFSAPRSPSPALNSCIGPGKVSSNSKSFASKTTGRQKSGMLFSPHEPRNVPERFVALIPKVCTRAGVMTRLSETGTLDVRLALSHWPRIGDLRADLAQRRAP